MLQEQVPPREAGAFAMGCGLSKFLWPRALFACRQQSCPLLVLASLHANVLRTLGVYWRLFAKLENCFKPTVCDWSLMSKDLIYLCARWLRVEPTYSRPSLTRHGVAWNHVCTLCPWVSSLKRHDCLPWSLALSSVMVLSGVPICFFSFSSYFIFGHLWCHVWRNYLSRLCSFFTVCSWFVSFNLYFNLRECSLLHVLFVFLMLGLYRYLDFFLN